ncbi:iron-containing redox enzyme family protein [Microcystis sp. LEGE 00066]|uniref:Iron-containing redox enzyme family protein n=1 Tax=Microcystis aeruginosa Ma_MB_F_20061100_S20D TaxID=2486253 RepID=A0A552EIN8_MICAE|nr:iron-containing redox enzyme family protein [Microcystis sp. LEGE 00066]MBE9263568.1 iron-containing redox enzyme family protein [Microcystis sp. LEGE 00066]MDY7047877.1 iron-containing redox enzyme family protein [Microcystis panniformis WG22]TRU34241.1 MAG: iron-containing redox enzyme family protein [Microcystis aeruginosa Ma_MB_F_20061100_S20D]TRU38263.1 MAG: iron-containing redox enzyme family protein [Microcystis aeruginosa Ma_MB_F_20061100_S20]
MKISFDHRLDRVVELNPPFHIPQNPQEARSLSQKVAYLLSGEHETLIGAKELLLELPQTLSQELIQAFEHRKVEALLEIQKTLYAIYEISFSNPLSHLCFHEHSPWLIEIRNTIENQWMKNEIEIIREQLPTQAEAKDGDALCHWFVNQAKQESQNDKEIVNFLEHHASVEQFNIFILSDAHLNYRFYDALALAQHYFSELVKTEIVHHMWDECGCGVSGKAHTVQFTKALMELNLPQPLIPIWEDWRPYAGHNLYFCFGLNRKYYFRSLGSLAMPELFDPDRNRAVVAGFERAYREVKPECEYFRNHIEGDEEHGERWLEYVITPIVKAQPEAGMELAIGGALRMEAMRRYNEYLATKFQLSEQTSEQVKVIC